MTEPNPSLDLLEHQDQSGAAARAEDRRNAAVQLVNGLFRLVKVLRIHSESNQATVALVDGMAAAIRDYCDKCNAPAGSILFADDAVFVNGQMLRASRETYAAALELGAILDKCGAAEVTFERSVGPAEVGALARAIKAIMRGQSPTKSLVEGTIPGIKLSKIRQALGQGGDRLDRASASERVLRTYASTIVVLREYLIELQAGRTAAPNRIRRSAQRLVMHVDEEPHLLTRIALAPTDDRDEVTIAVHAAILALVMARRICADRVLLAALVTSALLWDVAAVRLKRARPDHALGDAEKDRLAASAVVMHTALGRIQSTSIVRTVLAFEALWSRRAARRGPVYRGRTQATVLAGILGLARSFVERMQGSAGPARPRIDEVVQALIQGASDENERVLLRLLLAALGVVPGGTTVELNTGEQAIVAGGPVQAADFARPPVRIVRDAEGRALAKPAFVDLAGVPPRGQPARWIRRVVSPT